MSVTSIKNFKRTMYILLFLGWALGNLDRYVINYAVVFIGKDLVLTNTQTGLILSSFFLGYAIMQIPGGLLADKYGAKRIIILAIVAWSIFTGLTAVAWSLVSLIIVRFLFGFFEAGFQPSAASLIAQVFPKNERGKAIAVMMSSGALIIMIVPIISAWLLITIGWRVIFIICAILGVIVAYLYWRYIQLSKVEVEEEIIQTTGKKEAVLKHVLKIPMMWTVLLALFGIYAVNWGMWSWLPTYLTNVRNLDIVTIGWLQLIPGGTMFIAMLVNGVIIDKLSLRKNKYVGASVALLIAIFVLLMFQTKSIGLFITYQAFITIGITYLILLLPTMIINVVPVFMSGTAIGVGNTSAQLAGFATPMMIGFMVDAFNGSYDAVAWLLVGFAMLCVMAMLGTKLKTKEEEVSDEAI